MDLIFLIILIIIAGICMGAGVHFIPVGGAPAAMATATACFSVGRMSGRCANI